MNRIDGVIALSVSEPPTADLLSRGLTEGHVRHAFVELCRQVLARQGSIGYGGDLRRGGYSETLQSLLHTYSQDDRPAEERILQYLTWPLWADMPRHELAEVAAYATVVEVPAADPAEPRDALHAARCLSVMRESMTGDLAARVVLGGPTSGQVGRWPGVVEEAYLALRADRPLLVAGGLGGAAASVARALHGEWPTELTTAYQLEHTASHPPLLSAGVGPSEQDLREVLLGADPRDGLDDADRTQLHTTADLDHLVALVLRGLARPAV